MRSMRLDNTPSEEAQERIKAIDDKSAGDFASDYTEVVLDSHLGTTEVCPVYIGKHIIGVLGSCGKG